MKGVVSVHMFWCQCLYVFGVRFVHSICLIPKICGVILLNFWTIPRLPDISEDYQISQLHSPADHQKVIISTPCQCVQLGMDGLCVSDT